ncbi:DUF222 domain-containing protein [uncultured Microbacterium sp.]|uniref:HNH endonuclease signature motif containing protein n=1 Tax=uncultured Microbacterium sp. TaxID=191216 RepID=UPI0035CA4784
MATPLEMADLPPEVAALLWAERAAAAEEWMPVPDAECDSDPWACAVGADGSAIGRHIAGGFHAEDLLFEWERAAEQIARWQGVQTRLLAEALDLAVQGDTAGSDAELSVRNMAAELACAVGMSDRTIQQRMSDAVALRDRFPATFEHLRCGRFSRSHAQVVLDEGTRLGDDEARAAYEKVVLERSSGLTVGALRTVAKAVAEGLDPVSIAQRHASAREARHVLVRDVDDGMSELWALLPAVLAHGIHDRLTQQARSVMGAVADQGDAVEGGAVEGDAVESDAVDARSLDQVRADILCDVLLTGHATTASIDREGIDAYKAFRPIVQVTIPFLTLMGESDAVATLNGRIPIDPETARRLAGAATIWDRVLTDPCTGDVRAVDRRFPTEDQRRFLRARDEHCRFPGCRQSVWRCDADHTIDYQYGGRTEPGNLAHLCRRHHSLKGMSAWTVTQLPRGVLEWTSPLGRIYTDQPPPTLRFLPDS